MLNDDEELLEDYIISSSIRREQLNDWDDEEGIIL